MGRDLISVIVPVYNTGAALKRCVDSILNQTYSPIEIILVDDGSSDELTLSICQEYQDKHASIKLIRQENGGPSKARNTGIENARGTYIAFVDSDDVIDNNAYTDLLNIAKRYNVSIVLGAMSIEGSKQLYSSAGLKDGVYANEQIMSKFLQGHWHSTCTNLYSSYLIKDIRFPLNEINEDYIFNFEVILRCKDIAISNKPFYHYIKQENSRTSAPASLTHLDWLKHTEYVERNVISTYGNNLDGEAKFQLLFANIVLSNKCILSISEGITKEPNEVYALTTSNLKRLRKYIFTNKFLSMRFRLFGIALSSAPILYKNLILISLKVRKWIN